MTKNVFTKQQQEFIEEGAFQRSQMIDACKLALGLIKQKAVAKHHTWIYSPPGIGKTHTMNTLIKEHNIKALPISGKSSLSAFTVELAFACYMNELKDRQAKRQTRTKFVVWIDDCELMLMNKDAINLLKNAMNAPDQEPSWSYGVNLQAQISMYRNSGSPNASLIADALEYYQPAGSPGVNIPTDHITFVFTLNRSLIAPTNKKVVNGNAKAMAEAAINDRVDYIDFASRLDDQIMWGWLVDTALPLDLFGLSKAKKVELLVWMFDNWSRLSNNSMRAVEEYAAIMVNHPSDYPRRLNSKLNRVNAAK